jgi:hypothetical protein
LCIRLHPRNAERTAVLRNEAIKYLKAALVERSPGLVFLKVDSVWEPLRKDPEFVEVLRAVGLP